MNRPTPRPPQRVPWYAWPLAPFWLPVGLALLLLLGAVALVSVPVAGLIAGAQGVAERRFRRRLAGRGRFVAWADLVPALEAGAGTLILEQAHKCPVRAWWTPDDVVALAPCPPPGHEEMDILGVRPGAPHEFVAWCHRRYLAEEGGSARLTVPALALPPGLGFADFFRGRFPRVAAIDTVYCRDGGAPGG